MSFIFNKMTIKTLKNKKILVKLNKEFNNMADDILDLRPTIKQSFGSDCIGFYGVVTKNREELYSVYNINNLTITKLEFEMDYDDEFKLICEDEGIDYFG